MKFPWETDRLSRSEFEYRSRNQRVSEGLGDKMLTRVFSPTCWSQAERDEVTRCNLRQPSLTRTRLEGTNSPAADFAFLCFTLLCFTRTAAESALEGSVFYTRQDAPWQKSKVSRSHDRRTGVGNLRAICAYRRRICPSQNVIRPRIKGDTVIKKCIRMLRQSVYLVVILVRSACISFVLNCMRDVQFILLDCRQFYNTIREI